MEKKEYLGYKTIQLSDENLAKLYSGDQSVISVNLLDNQYLIIEDERGETVDKYVCKEGDLVSLPYQTLSNEFLGTIKPRNPQQQLVINSLLDADTKIKLIKGVYGSGKDFLMLSAALQLIEKGKFEKIVFIRPNVPVKGIPDIGALPGDVGEKLSWTLAPLYDKVGGELGVQMMISKGHLENVPLLFIRGRSFEHSIVYVTEGQNMTTEIAKLIIGRIGENSELWINADTHQTDKKIFDEDNGVNKMVRRLAGHPLFSYVYMPKTERSEVAELATLLDD